MVQVDVPPDVLKRELARYLAEAQNEPAAEREGAARHHILPLMSDFMGCWALDMEGVLVFVPWDSPEELEPVAGYRVERIGINVALAVGSQRYPALASIRPERPSAAMPCDTCDGSGRLTGVPENVICACGGLGWLPPGEET